MVPRSLAIWIAVATSGLMTKNLEGGGCTTAALLLLWWSCWEEAVGATALLMFWSDSRLLARRCCCLALSSISYFAWACWAFLNRSSAGSLFEGGGDTPLFLGTLLFRLGLRSSAEGARDPKRRSLGLCRLMLPERVDDAALLRSTWPRSVLRVLVTAALDSVCDNSGISVINEYLWELRVEL